jgi:hypothetical protein
MSDRKSGPGSTPPSHLAPRNAGPGRSLPPLPQAAPLPAAPRSSRSSARGTPPQVQPVPQPVAPAPAPVAAAPRRPTTGQVIPFAPRAAAIPLSTLNAGWGGAVPSNSPAPGPVAVHAAAHGAAAAALPLPPPPAVEPPPVVDAHPAPAPAEVHAPTPPLFVAPMMHVPARSGGMPARLGAVLDRLDRLFGSKKDPVQNANQWEVFEQLGLGPPKESAQQQRAKMIVSAYRALGFGILTLIVVILVGYIATSAFYFVSDSWVQPMVVSPTDEKVLALESQVTEQENVRDRILADLNHADRYIAVQQAYQAEFAQAIRADLSGRKAALSRVRKLAKDYAGARGRVQASNQAFASASRKRMTQEYAAGLIDRSDMLSGKFQLAQITSSNLSLAERQAEYETRAADLETEAQALDAILSEKGGTAALSYDVLKIKQEYEMSRLETAKAIESREALKASLTRQDAILADLRGSPWLRAVHAKAHVAFVPYGNLDEVSVGSPVYGCALEMIFCSKVGKVMSILPGEVNFKHPHREKMLRGKMIELELSDQDAAEDDVLFVGGRPLLF